MTAIEPQREQDAGPLNRKLDRITEQLLKCNFAPGSNAHAIFLAGVTGG